MAEYGKRWEEIARKYRIHIKLEKRLSENTVESYMRDLEQFAHFILRMWDVPPRKVEPQMVERYMAWLFDQGREKSSQARIMKWNRLFIGKMAKLPFSTCFSSGATWGRGNGQASRRCLPPSRFCRSNERRTPRSYAPGHKEGHALHAGACPFSALADGYPIYGLSR